MHESRVLWSRYQAAMDRHKAARDFAHQAAWWSESQEWLRRYFDSLDRQLELHPEQHLDWSAFRRASMR
jgi:hypothetical protein